MSLKTLFQPSPRPLPSGQDYTLRLAVPTRCPAVTPPLSPPPLSPPPSLLPLSPPNQNTQRGRGSPVRHGSPAEPFHLDSSHTRVQTFAFHQTADPSPLAPPNSWKLLVSPPPPCVPYWRRHTKTNTIFLSSSTRMRRSLRSHLVSLLLRVWRMEGVMGEGAESDGNGGREGSGTWVSCGKAECSLRPRSVCPSPSRNPHQPPQPSAPTSTLPLPRHRYAILYHCFSFGRESQEGSSRSHAAASNDLGKQALLCVPKPLREHGCAFLRRCAYLHVVFGVAPVPLGVQVAQVKALLLAQVDFCHGAADLARHKVCT